MPDSSARDTEMAFVLRFGRALHAYGYSSDELERVMMATAGQLGLDAQFFSTPTSINAAFGPLAEQRTFLLRVYPGEANLERLAELDRVKNQVLLGRVTPAEGLELVEAIAARPPRFGGPLRVAAAIAASGSAARLLGAGLAEVTIAAGLGAVIGGLSLLAGSSPRGARLVEALAAALAAFLVGIAAWAIGPFATREAIVASIVVLLPGLTLTLAMSELATGHLVSGTARMTSALMVFAALAIGTTVGTAAARAVVGGVRSGRVQPLPDWTQLVAIVVAALAFTVWFRARFRDTGLIVVVGALAVGGAGLGARYIGSDFGGFAGALIAGLASNALARYRRRPAALTLVPSVVLLVPGTIGFSSLSLMFQREVVSGVEGAFRTALVAVSLATGLLIADILLPSTAPVDPHPP
jgi:uncharacterized membrane protein YjjP (DUF1212 family)